MRILSVLLLLGIAEYVCSEKCPSEEELKPCVCENAEDSDDIVVRCEGYPEELTLEDIKHSINILSGKKDVELHLTQIQLGNVPSSIFKDIGLKKLIILYCELDSLSEADSLEAEPILSGTEDSLQVLDIHGSFDEDDDLTQLKFSHLRNLRELSMSGNQIQAVSNSWFDKGPASLDDIFLRDNGFEEIGDRAFADLPNLNSLLLEGNTLSSLERGMFPSSADHLEHLLLDKNGLTSLPDDIFSDMPELVRVSLISNEISSLNQETWESVWEQLVHCDLQGNPLECDSHMNWMFDLRAPIYLFGSCAAPEDKKGTKIEDFINNKG